jgi:hypothetical protein
MVDAIVEAEHLGHMTAFIWSARIARWRASRNHFDLADSPRLREERF